MAAQPPAKDAHAPSLKSKFDEVAEEHAEKKPVLASGLFGQKIKVDYDKPVQHNSKYLPNGHLCFNIIGCSGSGKSHVLLSLIPQIANLSQIIICSLITNNPVYDAIERYCESQNPSIEFAVLNDPQTATATIEEMIENKPEKTNGFIILDDFSTQASGRNDPYNKCAAEVSALLRNYGYHSAFITQSATNIPTLFRNNSNVRIVFQMNDTYAIQSIRRDMIGCGVVKDREEFDELYKLVQETEHAFLMMVNKGGQNNKLYIYLPRNGREEVEEVVFDSEQYDPTNDPALEKLLEPYRTCVSAIEGGQATAYTLIQRRRIKKMLHGYLSYLCQQYDLNEEDLHDIIEDRCKIHF